jgi:hypothetical protein
MPLKSHRFSLGTRLFFSAAVCCVLILVLAGVGLTTFYRRSAERGFDERLSQPRPRPSARRWAISASRVSTCR